MNILPDYLIKYMPEVEEALEELRLSVLDHAYELLQRLDIDELSVDEIRQKLELYDIKVDNMSGDWLPNGRFYRLYPSIKHHRSRHNTIKAIARSGGQFEGLWSTEFSNKSEYQFKDIQVMRHYQISSTDDGYFFVSGNTIKNARGQTISSAATALTTDILINQALPAGYTYLYIPWPRPVYPGDSSYFYNVNMLAYDRLHYAEDCDHMWKFHSDFTDSETGKLYHIYYCVDNSDTNKYCSILDGSTDVTQIQYGSSFDENGYIDNPHPFNNSAEGSEDDAPFAKTYDEDSPASTRYNWLDGVGTPWRTPYWIDYHYMNYMNRSLQDSESAGTWPVTESGRYYDENGDEAFEKEDAVVYTLDAKCKELEDSTSVFPTRCYLRERLKTTEPNRLQKFTPCNLVLTIRDFITACDNPNFVKLLCKVFHISESDFNIYVGNYYKEIDKDDFSYEIDETATEVNDITSYSYKVRVTLDDSLFNGLIRIKYNFNGIDTSVDAIFVNGVWESDPVAYNPIVEDLHCYDLNIVELIANDYIREQFENGLLSLTAIERVGVYQQSTNTLLQNAEYRRNEGTIEIKEDNATGFVTIPEFYSLGWIMLKNAPITLYYGAQPLSVYEDDCSGNIPIQLFNCDYSFDYSYKDSIDEHDLTEPDRLYLKEVGPYRWDKLYDGYLAHIKELLHHIKTYKPFWCEKTPWLDMCQSFTTKFSSDETQPEKHSLYNWMNLKQTENRPSFPFNESVYYDLYCNDSLVYTGKYDLTLISFVVNREVFGDLARAVSAVLGSGVDIFEMDDYPMVLATGTNKLQLENYISEIHNKFEDYTSHPDAWSLFEFKVVPTSKPASVIRDNEPPISEVTFTSYDRPTRGKLDPVYVGYLSDDIDTQDDNQPLNGSRVYIYDDDNDSGIGHNPTPIEYDPEYYYTIISLNYSDNDNHSQQESLTNCLWNASQDGLDNIYADFAGHPATGSLTLRAKTGDSLHPQHESLCPVHVITHATCSVTISDIIGDIGGDTISLQPGDLTLTNRATEHIPQGTVDFVLSQQILDVVDSMLQGEYITFTGIYDGTDVTLENSAELENNLILKTSDKMDLREKKAQELIDLIPQLESDLDKLSGKDREKALNLISFLKQYNEDNMTNSAMTEKEAKEKIKFAINDLIRSLEQSAEHLKLSEKLVALALANELPDYLAKLGIR